MSPDVAIFLSEKVRYQKLFTMLLYDYILINLGVTSSDGVTVGAEVASTLCCTVTFQSFPRYLS